MRMLGAFSSNSRGDGRNLFRCFPLGENYLGDTVAQRAVMIDLSEFEVLKRQVTDALESGIYINDAAADFLQ